MAEIGKRSEQPTDRLQRMGDAMLLAMDVHSEVHAEDKAIILLDDDERGAIVSYGYEADDEIFAAVFLHLNVLAEMHGKTLLLAPLGADG